MDIDTECLNCLVELNQDVDDTPLKQGMVVVVMVDIDEGFAVWFQETDIEEPWYSFDRELKELFTLVEE